MARIPTATRCFRAAFLLYLVLLTALLLMPDPWGWLLGPAPAIQAPDRGVHFGAFLVLAVLGGASRLSWPRPALAAALVGYAILTESLQALVETRVVDPIDYLENLLGLAAGSAALGLARRLTGRFASPAGAAEGQERKKGKR